MHLEHKAGDKLYIDFTGEKLHLTDHESGEIKPVEVFIAVLGCSQMTYCQAVYSQKNRTADAGVAQAIVPDKRFAARLKSAVIKSDRYEPDLNESLTDFAEHYQTNIYPARSRHPRDKAWVERSVGILYTRVFAPLKERIFSSLSLLNEVIRQQVDLHNQSLFQGKNYSRKMRFEELDRPTLGILPSTRYESQRRTVKALPNRQSTAELPRFIGRR